MNDCRDQYKTAIEPLKPQFQLEFLTQEQLDQMQQATLEILETCGCALPQRKSPGGLCRTWRRSELGDAGGQDAPGSGQAGAGDCAALFHAWARAIRPSICTCRRD